MAEQKLFAGHAVRRLRRSNGLSQAALAEALEISPSYLNLIERNQRPLTAALLLRLADQFDTDPRALAGASDPGGGMDAMRRRLADPMFADLEIDRVQIEEWLAAAPAGAEAFARAFDRVGAALGSGSDPFAELRAEIERWRNHFADLDSDAEALGDELRLRRGDLYNAIAERLLPVDAMPDRLRRLDLHARQLQLSELLDPASRTFGAAFQLAQLEAKDPIEWLVKGAGFKERASERLFRRHLTSYFAAALMMPYARFLRACEATGYDLEWCRFRTGCTSADDLAARWRSGVAVFHDPDRPGRAIVKAIWRSEQFAFGRGRRALPALGTASGVRSSGDAPDPACGTAGWQQVVHSGPDRAATRREHWQRRCRICNRVGACGGCCIATGLGAGD